MKMLVTGGAGFIGTALASKLKELKHEVSILDLKEKITDFHLNEFDSYDVDIRDYSNFDKLKNREFEIIFHLAAQTSARISQEHPELDVDTNVKGTLNVCNFARQIKTRKIIYTSSMAVYGNKDTPIKETDPLNPLSNYGSSKVSAEYFIRMFEQYNLKNTIFRLFNAYGPGQDMKNMKQGMASIYMSQSVTSNEIQVTGTFERYRDFVYIDDVVSALIMAVDGMDGEIINIGNGTKITVKHLIDLILEVHDKPKEYFKVINIGSHEGDTFGTVADNTRIKKYGWSPKTDIKTGLKKMYDYAVEILK